MRMAGLIVAVLAACATTGKPLELLSAEAAYDRAVNGRAGDFVPADLQHAAVALAVAETAFMNGHDGQMTRDLAYIAQREAQAAEAKGHIEQTARSRAHAEASSRWARANEPVQREVAVTREDAAEAARQLAATAARTDAAARHVVYLELVRRDAERSKAAVDDLSRITELHEEARGLVIVLPSDVIFEGEKVELVDAAQIRLHQLAEPLSEIPAYVIVDGHTDSRGSNDFNADLSFRRAEAVRDFLVSQGIAANRIEANGYGKTQPVAENSSAEGRARNRRIEIVVQRTTAAYGSVK